ncbi:hypothetical protein N0V93_006033 [Gnomoniopsis smithogilvyi]|uniref:Uncharacterized protein n=1 Tax=Gnomoniopsis smithogilvyi TaxID=1191159 RepID=A0A9W8YR56_9PEZI|nr:hypothetical protein N0V93_006033 [Gnomoniopsis smithogilvyi]
MQVFELLEQHASQYISSVTPSSRKTNSDSPVPSETTSATSQDQSSDNQLEIDDTLEPSSGTSITSHSDNSSVITIDDDTRAFISLLVRRSSRYVLSTIEVTKRTSRDFFQDLITHYHTERGLARRIFSIFVYSHCDFVKMTRYRASRVSPLPSFSFPTTQDAEYHEYTFSPQPMRAAPITRHMFYDLFYACYENKGLAHWVHRCDPVSGLGEDLLENMPKRDREARADSRFAVKTEQFWGIVAREQRSALRVSIYLLLGISPTIWFIFMWLFGWGHADDLQNATAPVTISLAALSFLWMVVCPGDSESWEAR